MSAQEPRTLQVRASAVLPEDMLVEITLERDPDSKLVAQLHRRGFREGDYPDLRVGPAGMLSAALLLIRGKSTRSKVVSVTCAESRELPPLQDPAGFARETILEGLSSIIDRGWRAEDEAALADAVVARTPDAAWATPVTIDRGALLEGQPLWDATLPVWGTATLRLGA